MNRHLSHLFHWNSLLNPVTWIGSEADFPGASSLVDHRYVVSTDADSSTRRVTVHITGTDSGVNPNASFSLVGICP